MLLPLLLLPALSLVGAAAVDPEGGRASAPIPDVWAADRMAARIAALDARDYRGISNITAPSALGLTQAAARGPHSHGRQRMPLIFHWRFFIQNILSSVNA